jgi:hypothetical protein
VSSSGKLHAGYDVFISYNHADKAWARDLANRIVNVDFNGRALRPWLDERFLDPGELAQQTELTSALDRSRTLAVVLSPASVTSKWVEFELQYFARDHRMEDVIPLLAAPCELPSMLDGTSPLDFTGVSASESVFGELVTRLCPRGGPSVTDAVQSVDRAWSATLAADPGGFDAVPSPERDELLAAMLRFDINNPGTEGLALTCFWRAAELLLRDVASDHPAAYNMRMVLGECVAVAVQRNGLYSQVIQRYLDHETAESGDPVLAFVAARACSKLAEISRDLIDLGVLLRIAARLDSHLPFTKRKQVVATLLGRVAAKLRGTDPGDLLIRTLSEGTPAARVAAIAAISMAEKLAPPVFYLSELERMYSALRDSRGGELAPPSRKLQALLFGIDLDQPPIIGQELDIAKQDLRRAFGIDDLPYGYFWSALRVQPPAEDPHHAPFMGTVVKATTANMEELALRLNAAHVVCLTQPQIVEALFERAGALLIPLQYEEFQARRLVGRGVPFAMLDAKHMDDLRDGDHVAIEPHRMRVVSQP